MSSVYRDETHYAPPEHWPHMDHLQSGCWTTPCIGPNGCNGCIVTTGCFCSQPNPTPPSPVGPIPPVPPSLPGNPLPIGCGTWRKMTDPVCAGWSKMNDQMKLNYMLCGTPTPCKAMTQCSQAAWAKGGVFDRQIAAFHQQLAAKNAAMAAKTQGQVAGIREQIADGNFSGNQDALNPYS